MMAAKVVIVTGASRGIGLAVAKLLIEEQQCKVVVTARSKEPLEQLKAAYPNQVQILAGDAADFSFAQKAVDLAKSSWDRLDGLVVNHGVLPVNRFSDTTAEEWRSAFDVNVFSAVALIKAAIPALRATKGKVVLVSSGAATGAYSAWGAYGASKAALNHVAMTLAVEEPDITTMAVRPGTVDTGMQREIREIHHATMDKKDHEKFSGLHTKGELLKPEQPGHVIARLVLDAPKEFNGKFLNWSEERLADFQDK